MRAWVIVVVMSLLAGCASDDGALVDSAELDSDEDGFTDEVEEALGTDPRNATSVPDVTKVEEITFSGTASVTSAGLVSGLCEAAPTAVDSDFWTIEAPEGNVSNVRVTDLSFVATGSASQVDIDIYVYGPQGDLLVSGTSDQPVERVTVEGIRDIGDYEIAIHGCLGTGEVTIEASGLLMYDIPPESVVAVAPVAA